MPLAIFDLDNTLIDRAGPFRRWATGFVDRHGLDPAEVDWLIAADGDGFSPRRAFIGSIQQRYDLAESVDQLLHTFRAEIVALIDPDPRVPELLDDLRAAGWLVAIATNGATAQQWSKIRRAGLDDRVDAVAVSEEVGAAKPDRRVFEAAAARSGSDLTELVRAGAGWMIGDCATRDIAGAHTVGLRTIWVRRGRDWDPSAPPPDAIVDDLDETRPILLG